MREEGREEGGKGAGESRVKGERRKREMRGEKGREENVGQEEDNWIIHKNYVSYSSVLWASQRSQALLWAHSPHGFSKSQKLDGDLGTNFVLSEMVASGLVGGGIYNKVCT